MAPSHVTPGLAIDTPASPSEVPRLIGSSQIRSDQDQIRPGQDGRVPWSRRRSAIVRVAVRLSSLDSLVIQTSLLQVLLLDSRWLVGIALCCLCALLSQTFGRRSFRRS